MSRFLVVGALTFVVLAALAPLAPSASVLHHQWVGNHASEKNIKDCSRFSKAPTVGLATTAVDVHIAP